VLELTTSSVLMALVLGGLGLATLRATALFESTTAINDLDLRAARASDRMARELLGSSSGNLEPDLDTPAGNPVVWSAFVDHRHAARWEAGAIVWEARQRLAWELEPGELDNDADDDGDGLVDEGVVVLVLDEGGPDEQRVTVVTGVAELLEGELANGVDDNGNGLIDERGLCFDSQAGTLNVRLTLQGTGPGGELIQRTQEVSVWPRNTAS
jgi:hypothetical protein